MPEAMIILVDIIQRTLRLSTSQTQFERKLKKNAYRSRICRSLEGA